MRMEWTAAAAGMEDIPRIPSAHNRASLDVDGLHKKLLQQLTPSSTVRTSQMLLFLCAIALAMLSQGPMFGLPGTVGHSPSPGSSLSAISTPSSSSSSAANVLLAQASSSVIMPPPGQPLTLHSQYQLPAICMEQPQPIGTNNSSINAGSPAPCANNTLTSLLANSLVQLVQQRTQQQQANALSLLCQQTPSQQLLSELLTFGQQQQQNPTTPAPMMPLPFPTGNALFGMNQSVEPSQSLLSAIQQKTAIDMLQKALEDIAVANHQPKLNGMAMGTPPPAIFPLPSTASMSGLYLGNGSSQLLAATQSQQPLQQQNGPSTVEQRLLALLSLQQQQQNGLHSQNGFVSGASPFCNDMQQQNSSVTNNPTCTAVGNVISKNGQTGHAMSEQPLDLSQRGGDNFFENGSACSSSSSQRRTGEIRRSVSSVSYYKKSNADVSEHFQRTFSGKWPKRQPSLRSHIPATGNRTKSAIGITKEGIAIGETVVEGEAEGRDSPMDEGSRASAEPPKMEDEKVVASPQPPRPKSRLEHRLGYRLIKKIFTSEDKQVEEHFRKSLGEDKFNQIQQKQQKQEKLENNTRF